MQRRQTIAFSIVATSFAPQGFTKAATPPSISFGDVEDAQAFGLNEWIRGLRLDADHASPSIARPRTKLGRTRQPDPCVHLRLRGRPARRESTPDAIEDHGCRCSERAGPSHRHARRAAGDRGPWVSLPLRAPIPEE